VHPEVKKGGRALEMDPTSVSIFLKALITSYRRKLVGP
jgi:hypothetical protein